jgi:hypothetical protein
MTAARELSQASRRQVADASSGRGKKIRHRCSRLANRDCDDRLGTTTIKVATTTIRVGYRGAQGPVTGAERPILAIGYGVYRLLKRRRKAD